MLTTLLDIIHVFVCAVLMFVVLLQQGKGADVASAFGASSSQTTFGARGATTIFEKITTWSFVAFSVLAITLSLVQSHPKGSVLAKQAPAKPASSAPKPMAPVVPAQAPSTAAAAPASAASAPAPASGSAAAPAPAAPAPATK